MRLGGPCTVICRSLKPSELLQPRHHSLQLRAAGHLLLRLLRLPVGTEPLNNQNEMLTTAFKAFKRSIFVNYIFKGFKEKSCNHQAGNLCLCPFFHITTSFFSIYSNRCGTKCDKKKKREWIFQSNAKGQRVYRCFFLRTPHLCSSDFLNHSCLKTTVEAIFVMCVYKQTWTEVLFMVRRT